MVHGCYVTHARASNDVASQWMARSRIIYLFGIDAGGQHIHIPKQPSDSALMFHETVLKQYIGAYETWKVMS